jgi:hypothetical protein
MVPKARVGESTFVRGTPPDESTSASAELALVGLDISQGEVVGCLLLADGKVAAR